MLAAAGFGLCVACRSEWVEPPRPERAAPVQPLQLIAELEAASPTQVWSALRRELGVRGRVFPEHLALVLTQVLGLPPALSGRMQADQPGYAALADSPFGLTWVFGFRVTSGREWVAELATGGDARFRKRVTGSVTHLEGGMPFGALGVVGNYVVIGSTPLALDVLAPYAVRARTEVAPANRVRITSVATGPALEAAFQTWASPVRADLATAAGKAGLSAAFASGAELISELVSDSLGEAGRGQLDVELTEGRLQARGSWQTAKRQDEALLCPALRALPGTVAGAAGFEAALPGEIVSGWLQALELPRTETTGAPGSGKASGNLTGPVVLVWVEEELRAALLVSFAADNPERVQRTMGALLGRAALTAGLVDGARRWKTSSRMLGSSHPLEIAWGFANQRGYLAVGASLSTFWQQLASNAAAPERQSRPSCEDDEIGVLWLGDLGRVAVRANGLERQLKTDLSLTRLLSAWSPGALP